MRALVLTLLLAGCAHRAKTESPVLWRDGYSMTRLEGTNAWAVRADTPAALERAKKEIGCGLCTDEPVTVHVIERK